MCRCLPLCTWMWKPEESVWCLPLYLLHLVPLRRASPWSRSLPLWLSWLARELSESGIYESPSQHFSYRHMHPCQVFHMGAGNLISDPHACKARILSHWATFQLPFCLSFTCLFTYVLFSILTEEIFLWLISSISAIFLWAASSTLSTWIATSY